MNKNKDCYICPIADKEGCIDCIHAKPHETFRMHNFGLCKNYAGECEKCVKVNTDWDK